MADTASDFAREVGPTGPGERGEKLLAISNAVVRLYKSYYGKGPTRARAYYQEDVITCVLRDCYTRAEQTLIQFGRSETVDAQRRQLGQAVRGEFIAAVESIAGRQVVGYFSDCQRGPDMSVEVFVLAPMDGGG
jgi:uncharacterized protein YbcI